jgi:polyisoprenoid-binding protein YceI
MKASILLACAPLCCVLAALGAVPGLAQDAEEVPVAYDLPVPAGDYALDKAHASLIFKVSHLGFSNYTARFTRLDAELTFDPENPESSSLVATVDPSSLETDFPAPETLDFNAQIAGPGWLEAADFPEIVYRSTRIERTGETSARIEGELTLHGVTQPLALEATYNGGYAGHPYEPQARIGFSATGALERSAFGVDAGIPAPGSNIGVSDRVDIVLEVEFNGPPLPEGAPAP